MEYYQTALSLHAGQAPTIPQQETNHKVFQYYFFLLGRNNLVPTVYDNTCRTTHVSKILKGLNENIKSQTFVKQ